VVGGLAPAEPGYRRIHFAPRPGGGLTSASARHTTPYGETAISWSLDGDLLQATMTVPFGTRAVFDSGIAEPEELEPGTHRRSVSIRPEL
jgi:alpha-L-rhamnosidase